MAKNPLKLARLRIYPVKGVDGMDVEAWDLDATGLRLDRRWMVVDASGRPVTQRDYAPLATVRAEVTADGLVLSAPHEASVEVPLEPVPGPTEPATIGGETLAVREASEDASRWLSKLLRVACRLVFLQDARLRAVDPALGTRKSALAFHDELPLQLLTAGSLEDLNGRVSEGLKPEHVRVNLLIEGAAPYDEDAWRRIRVGNVELHLVKPWPRDGFVKPGAEGAGPQALAALADRELDGRVRFGQLAIAATTAGQLRVGDAVEVLERGDPPSFGTEAEPEAPALEEDEADEEGDGEDEGRQGRKTGKKVRLLKLPGRPRPKAPDPGGGPDPWAAPEAPEATEEPAARPEEADAEEEPVPEEVAAEAPAPEEPASEEAAPEEPVPEEPEPEEPEPEEPEPEESEPEESEPEEPTPEEPEPEEPSASAAETAEAVEVEVSTDRVPELDETARLLAAAAVAEGKAATQKLAEACLRAPVLITAWKGDALVGLLRGWTDEVRDGFIADVAVHPDQHGSGAAQALVERVVAQYPEIRWVLRASPGSAYLGSGLGWQHAGSGWYLSPR